ncbi:hypothetical protein SCUCBS95973_001460 [Sporothrix curviconia]|uniref:ATP-dependent DNA ligase family profile domain-containing protein n=1 Tax=Sporothrix curviconia TaxID=1260050 RepID=A0ABP0AYS3_9PEZI
MPFLFAHVCDLFQQVEDLPPAQRNQPRAVNQVIQAWFAAHRTAVDEIVSAAGNNAGSAAGSSAASALLSTLLPGCRTDRVYGLQARGLQRILIGALGLGHSRIPELSRWMRPSCEHATTGPVDLADCVEAILRRTPNPVPAVPVSVEEVDAVLHSVAARCRFSSPAVRASISSRQNNTNNNTAAGVPHTQSLTRLYQRLDAGGAKWFTRLVLKDLRPVVLDDAAVARAFHPGLARALQVHADLAVAVQSLTELATHPRPQIGTKVGRQTWAKGRSIQNCIAIAGPQRMSCEHKMDGEYVQVHVDLVKEGGDGGSVIQLFSKSGKDSTWDRVHLHSAIRDSLRLGRPDCPLTKGCILEGEMLAYDEQAQSILGFDAIRRHVNRSGTRLYVDPRAEAEVRHCHEHLMIVYYDVLLVDDESLLQMHQSERFRRLQSLIHCRPGYAELVPREIIDFGAHTAPALLRRAFARCITARLEGLVLKPENAPYFDFGRTALSSSSHGNTDIGSSCIIKLKRGYVGGFGEVGDFAVVGGRYDASKAREYPSDLPGLRWTHFFLGCLDTTKSLTTTTATPGRPRFVVTNVVMLPVAQMAIFLKHCRPRTVAADMNKMNKTRKKRPPGTPSDLEAVDVDQLPFDVARLEPGLDDSKGGPSDWFADPPVVEIRCFSFHRQGYGRFWSPRFPNVTKFHFDRSAVADVVTYDALQAMAEEATTLNYEALEEDGDNNNNSSSSNAQEEAADGEHAHWVERLRKADRRGIAMDAETSQSSAAASAASTARSQSQAQSQSQTTPVLGTSQRGPAPTTVLPPAMVPLIEIDEEDHTDSKDDRDDRDDRDDEKQTQLSIVTVKTYDNDRYGQNEKKTVAAVTVIDLTGDDDNKEDGNAEEKRPVTPTPTAPTTPATVLGKPETPKTPVQAVSPLPPASCSPIDFVSSLTMWSTDASQNDSQESRETELSERSQQDERSEDRQDERSENRKDGEDPKREDTRSKGTPLRKRHRSWDVSTLYPAVSPPMLKRARSGV